MRIKEEEIKNILFSERKNRYNINSFDMKRVREGLYSNESEKNNYVESCVVESNNGLIQHSSREYDENTRDCECKREISKKDNINQSEVGKDNFSVVGSKKDNINQNVISTETTTRNCYKEEIVDQSELIKRDSGYRTDDSDNTRCDSSLYKRNSLRVPSSELNKPNSYKFKIQESDDKKSINAYKDTMRESSNNYSYGCECYLKDTKYININNLIETFQNQVSSLLRKYYLTDAEIFNSLADLIGISMEYIQLEYKENINISSYNERTKRAVENLYDSILSNCGENDFTEYLKQLRVGNYLNK